ncbi:hypothetical protein [Salinibaculum rarum]|uniref:hypothetical protein n=1 Tax=Salinibaculum rarum TaxID=3058903 RepID=UPI0026601CCC|nr:hypothetical protein [Salinibaculum sp. KK48]
MSEGHTTPSQPPDANSTPETVDIIAEIQSIYSNLGLLPACDFISLSDIDHVFIVPPPTPHQTPTLTALWELCITDSVFWTPAEIEGHKGAVLAYDDLAKHYKTLHGRTQDLPEPRDAAFLFSQYVTPHEPAPHGLTLSSTSLRPTDESNNTTKTGGESGGAPACRITLSNPETTPPTDDYESHTVTKHKTEPEQTWHDRLSDLPGVLTLDKHLFTLPAEATDTFVQAFSPPRIDITPEHHFFDIRETEDLI